MFGVVGKLHITLPWRALSSEPVEIILEGVHLIVSPKPRDEWKYIDFNRFDRKLELLEEFVADLTEKIEVSP